MAAKNKEPKTREDYCKREEFIFSRQFLQLALDDDVTDMEWAELSRAVVRYVLTGKKETVSKSIKLIYLEQCKWFDDKFSAWLKVCTTNAQNRNSHNEVSRVVTNGDKSNAIDRLTDSQTDRLIDRLTEQSDSQDRYHAGNGPSADAGPKPAFAGKVVHHP